MSLLASLIPSITFLLPFAFVALLPALGLLIVLVRRSRVGGVPFRYVDDLMAVYGRGRIIPRLLFLFAVVALAAGVVVFAHPALVTDHEEISRDGIDVALVLDISKSMLAEDIHPSRIEAAKKTMSDFISKMPDGDRVSVTVFAGRSYASVPPTWDHDAAAEIVRSVSTDTVHQEIPGLSGTAIGDGILTALNMLDAKVRTSANPRDQVIILLTDGAANMGIHPEIAARYAAEKHVRIYTIGIGDPAGSDLYVTDQNGNKQYFVDGMGQHVRADLDQKMLQRIADDTGGRSWIVTDADALKNIFTALAGLHHGEAHSTIQHTHTPYSHPFAIILLVAVIGYALFSFLWEGYSYYLSSTRPELFSYVARDVLFFFAILSLVVSVVGFRIPWFDSLLTNESVDVVFLLDTSQSMAVMDGDPVGQMSRLDRAKSFIDTFVKAHPEDRYGLVAFAGHPVMITPVTSDTDFFLTTVAGVNTHTIEEQGSDIVAAISRVVKWLGTGDPKHRMVVLLSDGGDPGENNPQAVRKLLADAPDVHVSSVGFGSVLGGPIPDGADTLGLQKYKELDGEVYTSKRNDEALNTIAYTSGGAFLVIDDSTVDTLARRIAQVEHSVSTTAVRRESDSTRPLALAGFLCFVVAIMIPYRRIYA